MKQSLPLISISDLMIVHLTSKFAQYQTIRKCNQRIENKTHNQLKIDYKNL